MDKQTENSIVENVLKALKSQGMIGGEKRASSTSGEPVQLVPTETIGVDNPHNPEALKMMRKSTPARILMGRAGARQKTSSYLNFLADHAAAVDAVFKDVSTETLDSMGLFKVQTVVKDKDEYLMRPELGKMLGEDAEKEILAKCEKGKKVQIIVVDGLSSTAVDANVAELLPALMQGLRVEGIDVGTPFFIKYGRVGVMDRVGELLECDVVVELVGERPGLITAESLSSYMVYKPSKKTVEADRTILSNIHRGGTPPAEAGAHMATIVKQMLDHRASGVTLSEALK